MEPFRYKSEDALGRPLDVTFNMNYPLIASIGTSYTGFENWILACDLRFFDYADTTGFRDVGFSSARRLAGSGVEQHLLGGPRRATAVERSLERPRRLLLQREPHRLRRLAVQRGLAADSSSTPCSLGRPTRSPTVSVWSLAYTHCFENSVTGPLFGPSGAIAGTVTSTASADAVSFGLSKRF